MANFFTLRVGFGVSQHILTDALRSRLLASGSARFRRRIWLTFAALRIRNRSAIHCMETVVCSPTARVLADTQFFRKAGERGTSNSVRLGPAPEELSALSTEPTGGGSAHTTHCALPLPTPTGIPPMSRYLPQLFPTPGVQTNSSIRHKIRFPTLALTRPPDSAFPIHTSHSQSAFTFRSLTFDAN